MKTILVTGGNRGIGLEICRQLDRKGHQVIMGSRDLLKGKEAAMSINGSIIVGQLNVNDEKSIVDLYGLVESKFGSLDVLINNAGVGPGQGTQEASVLKKKVLALESRYSGIKRIKRFLVPMMRKSRLLSKRQDASSINVEVAKEIMETNLFGAWRMIHIFLPLLLNSKGGRIINVSSGSGELGSLTGQYPGYSLSKASLNALTIMFANELKRKGIKVNAMCPGWVRTDMGGPNAPRDVSQGADTAVWLSLDENIPTGKFFRDRKEINW